jgi:translin
MKNLDEIVDKIEEELNEKDILREKTLKICRDIIRESRKSIKNTQSSEDKKAIEHIKNAQELVDTITREIKNHHDILAAGYMENAMQELAEASLFSAIMRDNDFPTPEEIGISYTSYLLGLADVVGELRRKGVYLLKDGNVEEVVIILDFMEEISDRLIEFDYPSGLIPIKRKQDVVKRMLEKMRGEVALFKKSKELENKIEVIINRLKKKKRDDNTGDIGSLL